MSEKQVVIEVNDIEKYFPVSGGFLRGVTQGQQYVHAVDGVSFKIYMGETFGLVGESGCGKSTTGMVVLQLLGTTNIRLRKELKEYRKAKRRWRKEIREGIKEVFSRMRKWKEFEGFLTKERAEFKQLKKEILERDDLKRKQKREEIKELRKKRNKQFKQLKEETKVKAITKELKTEKPEVVRKNIFYSIILTVISGLAIGWDIGRDYLYFIWTQIPDWIIYERYLIPLIINTVIGATLLILIIRYLIQGRITILDKSASPIPLALSFVNLILYTNLNPLSFYLSWIPVFLVSFVIFILGWRVEVTYNIKWMVILEGAFFIRRKKWQEVKQLRIKGRKQFTKLKEEILEREDNRGVFFKNVKISQYTRGYLWKNTIRDGCSALIGRTSWNDVKTSYRESSQQVRFFRKNIQIIFQNPYESLSPRFNVLDAVAEPLRLMNIVEDEDEIEKMVINELEEVGLVPGTEFLDRYPHELSGGQRQRIGVARAFILDPEFVVADEPVSMLDVSIRVGVLKIMRELTKSRGTGFLFITHDLALARHMCDRIAAMYLGRIVELGPTEELVHRPLHPYTKALIKAVPKADPDARRTEDLPIQGEVPSGIQVPSGCRFHPRCPYAIDKCTEEVPELVDTHIEGHKVACIRYKEINDL